MGSWVIFDCFPLANPGRIVVEFLFAASPRRLQTAGMLLHGRREEVVPMIAERVLLLGGAVVIIVYVKARVIDSAY